MKPFEVHQIFGNVKNTVSSVLTLAINLTRQALASRLKLRVSSTDREHVRQALRNTTGMN